MKDSISINVRFRQGAGYITLTDESIGSIILDCRCEDVEVMKEVLTALTDTAKRLNDRGE